MIINDQDGLYLYKHSNYIVDTAYFNDEGYAAVPMLNSCGLKDLIRESI